LKLREKNLERTFLAVKPDGVQRGLVGEIIRRYESKGFTLVGLKLMQVSRELAEQHYDVHKGKPFFAGLVEFITSGPVVAMVWEGEGVVASARKIIGATNPLTSEPGTIRGDYGVSIGRNLIHGSDAPETAQREIGLWFKPEELVGWQPTLTPWLYE
jgi:nucleoside-diphosphate kinase